MRLVPINEVQPGMVLAKTIYRPEDGRILLRADIVLKATYIRKVKNLNYEYIYIQDSETDEEEIALKPIREETRSKAIEIFKKTVHQYRKHETLDITELTEIINEMIDHILANPQIIYNIVDIRNYDRYTFTHSVNVTVISLLMGSVMGMHRNELEVLGIGAMLHDIGKITIDKKVLNKASKLDSSEFDMIKGHAREGYEILKTKVQISFLPAHVAFQHHEREDGSGYPRGLTGNSIHQHSKIVAIADVFDAMTSDRVYRKALPSYLAVREIVTNNRIKYDQNMVEHFVKVVVPYPKGTVLLLSDGKKVVVTSVSRLECQVRVIEGIHIGQTFNLYQLSDVTVVKHLTKIKKGLCP